MRFEFKMWTAQTAFDKEGLRITIIYNKKWSEMHAKWRFEKSESNSIELVLSPSGRWAVSDIHDEKYFVMSNYESVIYPPIIDDQLIFRCVTLSPPHYRAFNMCQSVGQIGIGMTVFTLNKLATVSSGAGVKDELIYKNCIFLCRLTLHQLIVLMIVVSYGMSYEGM